MKLKADYLKRVIEELPDARTARSMKWLSPLPIEASVLINHSFLPPLSAGIDTIIFELDRYGKEWEIEIDTSKEKAESLKFHLDQSNYQKTILMHEHMDLKESHVILEKQFKSLRSKWFVKLYLWLHWKWIGIQYLNS